MSVPFLAQYDGDTFAPLARFQKLCDKEYTVGQIYQLAPIENRSSASHRHYFAAVHDAWLNLNEDLAERFQTSKHLRKFALIKCGFADERSIVCASRAEAQRVAAFIKPMDEYALVSVQEATVRVWTAKSQSTRAMGRAEFQRSKDAVLDFLSETLGVERKTLEQEAGRAA